MLLVAPSGAEVDAAEESVARLLSNGFSKPKGQGHPAKARLPEGAGRGLAEPEPAEATGDTKEPPAKPRGRKEG